MGLRSFLTRFKNNLAPTLPSLIGVPADAACWQGVATALTTAKRPNTGSGVGDALIRGIPAGVAGGVADGVASFITNLIYAKIGQQHGVKFADIAKKTIFQWVQASINGVTWQALASGGEALGEAVGGSVGKAVGGTVVCFAGTFLTTWLSNKVFSRIMKQNSGVSSFATAMASAGFYLVGPLPDFSASGDRDPSSAAALSVAGALLGALGEEAVRSGIQEYREAGRGEGQPLLAAL